MLILGFGVHLASHTNLFIILNDNTFANILYSRDIYSFILGLRIQYIDKPGHVCWTRAYFGSTDNLVSIHAYQSSCNIYIEVQLSVSIKNGERRIKITKRTHTHINVRKHINICSNERQLQRKIDSSSVTNESIRTLLLNILPAHVGELSIISKQNEKDTVANRYFLAFCFLKSSSVFIESFKKWTLLREAWLRSGNVRNSYSWGGASNGFASNERHHMRFWSSCKYNSL